MVSIVSPADGSFISGNLLSVTVAFSAKLEKGKFAGNVQTVILKMNGTEVGQYENPPQVKWGSVTFNVDVSSVTGVACFQAEAYQGKTTARLVERSAQVCVSKYLTARSITEQVRPGGNEHRWWSSVPVVVHLAAQEESV
ncbi:MAG: Ig-like domain-containing protein [Planctomycetes bacterium]|nr:Ig-like domain-containing protein [Planctomycetota bacterium]